MVQILAFFPAYGPERVGLAFFLTLKLWWIRTKALQFLNKHEKKFLKQVSKWNNSTYFFKKVKKASFLLDESNGLSKREESCWATRNSTFCLGTQLFLSCGYMLSEFFFRATFDGNYHPFHTFNFIYTKSVEVEYNWVSKKVLLNYLVMEIRKNIVWSTWHFTVNDEKYRVKHWFVWYGTGFEYILT